MKRKFISIATGFCILSILFLCSCDASMYLDETGTNNSQDSKTNVTTSTNSTELVLSTIPITRAESDSFYHSSSSNIDYTVDFTIDGNVATCWQDGRDDDGIGDTLTYFFDECEISAVGIINGNRKNNNSYPLNNRLAEINISFYLNDDLVTEQIMSFEDDENIEETLFELDTAIICNSIVITIESVYPGTDYNDTGISEVSFYSYVSVPVNSNTATNTPTPTPNPDANARCEYSYVVQFRNSSYPDDVALNYDLYVMFDTDTNKVYEFLSTSTNFISVGTYEGTITTSGGWGVEVNWNDGDWWYVSGDPTSIDVSDTVGYCFYAERVSSAEIEAVVNLP